MDLKNKTIKDFGEQWTTYTSNDGFYGSLELFEDMVSPLITVKELANKRVAEIGSGTGRIAIMLLNAGVSHVTAIEPSDAFYVLQHNIAILDNAARRTRLIKCPGDEIPENINVDYIFSIGVLHHIPDPDPVVKAAYKALSQGGKILVWLYGKEGNQLYLFFIYPIRKLTKLLPHSLLVLLVWILYLPLMAYSLLCHWFPLPLKDYLVNVICKMSPDKRRLVIYDQLNPAYAKYYTKDEAESLLTRNGFKNVTIHHRRGYSWTVSGEK